MGYKKKVRNIVILCIILTSASLILALPENFGLCQKNDDNCIYWFMDKFDNTIQSIFYFSLATIIVSAGLYFSGKKAFNAWKKFAMFYLPISIVLIMLSPATNMNFIGFDKELTTLWLAGIFFIISIIIILVKREKHGVLEEEEC